MKTLKEISTLILPSLLVLLVAGCAGLLADRDVHSAIEKKETICTFIEVWAPANPELQKPLQLCQADAHLKEIAAAYAGCETLQLE